jgi:hypothetical protein
MSSLTTAEGDKRGLDVIRRDVMRLEPAVDDNAARSMRLTPTTTTAVQSKARELGSGSRT